MSRFGGNNHTTVNHRFGYNPFQQEAIFKKPSHWELVRNNVDVLIKTSKLIAEQRKQQQNEEDVEEDTGVTIENSRCNEIETIYECVDDLEGEDVKEEPPAVLVAEPEATFPAKKRMDFASVVFKYRNELAKRKHKVLQA